MIKRKLVSASITSVVSSILYGILESYSELKDGMVHGSFPVYIVDSILFYGIYTYFVICIYGSLTSVISELIVKKIDRNQTFYRGTAHVIFGFLGIPFLRIVFLNQSPSFKEDLVVIPSSLLGYAPIFIALIFFGVDEWLRNSSFFHKHSKWFIVASIILLLFVLWRISLAY